MNELLTDLPGTLKRSFYQWLGQVPDLQRFMDPNVWSDPNTAWSFAMEYAGLTWEHVYDVVRQQIGAGNLAALEQVTAWFNDSNPTSASGMAAFISSKI